MTLVRWTNGAIWRKGIHTNKHRYGILDTAGGASIVGVNIETAATAGIFNGGPYCRFNLYIFGILGSCLFSNSGSYIVARITGQVGGIGSAGVHVANSGCQNEFSTKSTGGLGILDITGRNHNSYERNAFVGSGTPFTSIFGSYDTAHIIADKGASTEGITRLGPIMRSDTSGSRPSFGAGNTGTYYDTGLGLSCGWDRRGLISTAMRSETNMLDNRPFRKHLCGACCNCKLRQKTYERGFTNGF